NGKGEYLRAAPRIIKESRHCDIIHCHHLLSALPVLMVKPLLKARVIVSLMSDGQNEILLSDSFAARPFKSWAYNLVISRSNARIFKKAIPTELVDDPNSHYLPNGVNLSLFKPMDPTVAKHKLGLDPDKDYVLFV